ncbi:MAG: hypothetical protein AAGI52_16195 [Bacteroidota bacterium]
MATDSVAYPSVPSTASLITTTPGAIPTITSAPFSAEARQRRAERWGYSSLEEMDAAQSRQRAKENERFRRPPNRR